MSECVGAVNVDPVQRYLEFNEFSYNGQQSYRSAFFADGTGVSYTVSRIKSQRVSYQEAVVARKLILHDLSSGLDDALPIIIVWLQSKSVPALHHVETHHEEKHHKRVRLEGHRGRSDSR